MMPTKTPLVGLALVLAASITGASQLAPITATTGPAVLIETGGAGVSLAMTAEEYQKLAVQLVNAPGFVAMTKKPDNVSTNVRFGINFSYGGKNRTWALDGNDTDGYTLYADRNANGDLSDDGSLKFELKDGKYFAYFDATVTLDGDPYPIRYKLEVDRIAPPGKTGKELALMRYGSTRRSGEVIVGGKPVKFAITGQQGIYNQPFTGIRFDLNGDGTFDPDVEVYLNSEKYVNVSNTTYEFAADRLGRSLTLTPLAEKRPDRVVLKAGYAAPDFSFTDLQGRVKKLSDYRGKIVLIDFWGTWCGPCVAEVSRMVETYKMFHDRGFEILGIDTGDTKDKLQAFISEKQMPWSQTMEVEKGPIHTLFRVTGWPTYFLIGKDGNFIVAGAFEDKFDLATELEKLLK